MNTPDQKADALPQNAIWIFSGTADGNLLTNKVLALGFPVVLSVATEHGWEMANKNCPGAFILDSTKGKENREDALVRSYAKVIIDATHPYAVNMSLQLIELSNRLLLPYIRYERPVGLNAANVSAANVYCCDTMDAAANLAIEKGKRIFLGTGSKDLPLFLSSHNADQREWFVRITPVPEMVSRALSLGIPIDHICAMQGPFSQSFNEALWKGWQIDCVVTKDSGDAGGYSSKASAAAQLGIPLIVVNRPVIKYPFVTSDFSVVLDKLQTSIGDL